VRAVLVGPFAPSDGSTRAMIGARLGREALAAVGKAVAGSAKATDFAAAAKALNPVYQKGGCLGVKVDIADLTVGKVDVALVPKPGAIDTTVSVDDIAVRLDVRYEVACIGGNATMIVRTKARERGDLAAVLSGRQIRTSLRPVVVLEDFQLDLGALPGPIATLLRGGVRMGVERALLDALERKVPPLADAKLAELLSPPSGRCSVARQDRGHRGVGAPRPVFVTAETAGRGWERGLYRDRRSRSSRPRRGSR
jgi:hypothetical protein